MEDAPASLAHVADAAPTSPVQVGDGIANMISRLGTRADRNTHSMYWTPHLTREQIEHAYRSSWLTRKVHDLPPYEMTRARRKWQAKKEQITALEKAERKFQIWAKLRKALSTARLHGGAAIIMGIRQGSPDQPLVVDALRANSLRYMIVVSRHRLSAPFGFDQDPESDFYLQPQMWEMRGPRGRSVRVHPSRVITFHGAPLPDDTTTTSQLDQFWGDPILTSLKSAIENADTSQAAVATLLHELKQDVISIPGLTTMVATGDGEALLAKRVEALAALKSMFNALLLDGGDKNGNQKEEWNTRELSFAQHPELLDKFLGIVAGAADIPATRLLAQSPGGLQSTGKGEQDDFNRMIAARQDDELTPPLDRIDEVLLRSVFGTRDEAITWEYGPLDEPDEKEISENDKRDAETVEIYQRTGLVETTALAKAVQNRMIETGRWPGLEQAIAEAQAAGKMIPAEASEEREAEAAELGAQGQAAALEAANENAAVELERRKAVGRDQALLLIADASPRSLYVARPVLPETGRAIHAWALEAGFTEADLVPVDELHVTEMYSPTAADWLKAGTDWNEDEDGNMTVPAGGARIVEPLGDMAAVLLFNSSRLSWRHEQIGRDTGARHTHADYQPHVSFAKTIPAGLDLRAVEPFREPLRLGPEVFEEIKAYRYETTPAE